MPKAAVLRAVCALTACGSGGGDIAVRHLTDFPGDEMAPVFSPDGSHLAFTSNAGGKPDIMVRELETGFTVSLTNSPNSSDTDPQWSPDGSTIAFVSDRTGAPAIWTVPAEGGQPNPLTDFKHRASRPRWSPDGRTIAFGVASSGSGDVWVMDADGRQQRPLVVEPGQDYLYGWSPDGANVLLLSIEADRHDIWAVPLNGSAPTPLTSHEGEEWRPEWSPDGRYVVFYSTWDDAMTEVWVTDVTTHAVRRITNLEVEDFHPSWSPDGKWIAFNSDRQSKSGLWITSLDTSVVFPVVVNARVGERADWAPGGTSLAFSAVASNTRLVRAHLSDGSVDTLSRDEQNVFAPVADPTGARIAFDSDNVGSEADIAILELELGEIIYLTREIDYNARPSWSPAGDALVFERSAGGGPRTTNVGIISLDDGRVGTLTTSGFVRGPVWCGGGVLYVVEHSMQGQGPNQIWRIAADGSNPVQLTRTPGNKRVTDCSADGRDVLLTQNPSGDPTIWRGRIADDRRLVGLESLGSGEGARWSPDGERIVFLSTRNGTPDVYVMSLTDRSVRRLTQSPVEESWPDFTPDGESVIYSVNPGGRDIWLADVAAELARHQD